MTINTI